MPKPIQEILSDQFKNSSLSFLEISDIQELLEIYLKIKRGSRSKPLAHELRVVIAKDWWLKVVKSTESKETVRTVLCLMAEVDRAGFLYAMGKSQSPKGVSTSITPYTREQWTHFFRVAQVRQICTETHWEQAKRLGIIDKDAVKPNFAADAKQTDAKAADAKAESPQNLQDLIEDALKREDFCALQNLIEAALLLKGCFKLNCADYAKNWVDPAYALAKEKNNPELIMLLAIIVGDTAEFLKQFNDAKVEFAKRGLLTDIAFSQKAFHKKIPDAVRLLPAQFLSIKKCNLSNTSARKTCGENVVGSYLGIFANELNKMDFTDKDGHTIFSYIVELALQGMPEFANRIFAQYGFDPKAKISPLIFALIFFSDQKMVRTVAKIIDIATVEQLRLCPKVVLTKVIEFIPETKNKIHKAGMFLKDEPVPVPPKAKQQTEKLGIELASDAKAQKLAGSNIVADDYVTHHLLTPRLQHIQSKNLKQLDAVVVAELLIDVIHYGSNADLQSLLKQIKEQFAFGALLAADANGKLAIRHAVEKNKLDIVKQMLAMAAPFLQCKGIKDLAVAKDFIAEFGLRADLVDYHWYMTHRDPDKRGHDERAAAHEEIIKLLNAKKFAEAKARMEKCRSATSSIWQAASDRFNENTVFHILDRVLKLNNLEEQWKNFETYQKENAPQAFAEAARGPTKSAAAAVSAGIASIVADEKAGTRPASGMDAAAAFAPANAKTDGFPSGVVKYSNGSFGLRPFARLS